MSALDYGIRPPVYRLPDGAHVGRVHLQVSNVTRSLTYYRYVLGLQVVNDADAVLGVHANHGLVQLHERQGARAVPHSGVLGLFHFAILLPDRPSLGRFLKHVAHLGVPFQSADHLVSEALYLWDPDGLGIEVYADRPRSEWRVERDQLVMATDPLDLESLVASGGREPWNGMPAGTSIGHIHLQVADLDRARHFYHTALGFDIVVWSYPGALFMSAGGYHHQVGTNTWARQARPADDRDAQLLEWELVLPAARDAAAAAASVSAAGYAVSPDGVVADPWNTRVRFVPRNHGTTEAPIRPSGQSV